MVYLQSQSILQPKKHRKYAVDKHFNLRKMICNLVCWDSMTYWTDHSGAALLIKIKPKLERVYLFIHSKCRPTGSLRVLWVWVTYKVLLGTCAEQSSQTCNEKCLYRLSSRSFKGSLRISTKIKAWCFNVYKLWSKRDSSPAVAGPIDLQSALSPDQ